MSKKVVISVTAVLVTAMFAIALIMQQHSLDRYPGPIETSPGTIDTVHQPADTIVVKSVQDSILLQSLVDRTNRLERRVDTIEERIQPLWCGLAQWANRLIECQ